MPFPPVHRNYCKVQSRKILPHFRANARLRNRRAIAAAMAASTFHGRLIESSATRDARVSLDRESREDRKQLGQ